MQASMIAGRLEEYDWVGLVHACALQIDLNRLRATAHKEHPTDRKSILDPNFRRSTFLTPGELRFMRDKSSRLLNSPLLSTTCIIIYQGAISLTQTVRHLGQSSPRATHVLRVPMGSVRLPEGRIRTTTSTGGALSLSVFVPSKSR